MLSTGLHFASESTALMSARRIRPKLTLGEIEISHGRRAARILADAWTSIVQGPTSYAGNACSQNP